MGCDICGRFQGDIVVLLAGAWRRVGKEGGAGAPECQRRTATSGFRTGEMDVGEDGGRLLRLKWCTEWLGDVTRADGAIGVRYRFEWRT